MLRLLILCSLLTACGSVPVEHFEDSRVLWVRPGTYEVELTVVVDDAEGVRERCAKWITDVHNLGCTIMIPGHDERLVIIPVLRDANDSRVLEIIGHEFVHGVFGDWHL